MPCIGYHPNVNLIANSPNPESIVSAAAKLCYAQNVDNIDKGDPKTFVKKLMDMGHMSPLEHISFTFYIQNVSRALLAQITRHRIASFSVRSQRYVDHEEFSYIIPTELVGKKIKVPDKDNHYIEMDAVEYYTETMQFINARYAKLKMVLGNKGETSNEIARYVLPNSCETKLFVTMNARELIHFFGERCCNRAQSEIRKLAYTMLNIVKAECPTIFEEVGPKCDLLGHCPEGSKYCGRTLKGEVNA